HDATVWPVVPAEDGRILLAVGAADPQPVAPREPLDQVHLAVGAQHVAIPPVGRAREPGAVRRRARLGLGTLEEHQELVFFRAETAGAGGRRGLLRLWRGI